MNASHGEGVSGGVKHIYIHVLSTPFALFLLLAAIYMLTYSGRIELGDEIQYFDAVGNMAMHGQMAQDLSIWQPGAAPTDFSQTRDHPLRIFDVEPLFITAAVPLYQLAEQVDGLGLVHTVYIFNVIVTALIGVAFYSLVVTLGYTRSVAILGALSLGLLTILWPYSQTFFREPLMILLTLVGVVGVEKARTSHRKQAETSPSDRISTSPPAPLSVNREGETEPPLRRLFWGCAALAAFGLAFLTKEAFVLGLPGIAVMALPDRVWRSRWVMRLTNLVLVALLIVPVLLVYTDVLATLSSVLPQVALLGRFALELEETQLVLHIFAFSVGGSFWGSSPILLLALPGAWLLWRRADRPQDRRIVLGALMVAFGYCVGYALFRGETWHAGTVWPQRFLLPVIPFAFLPVLSVFSRIFSRALTSPPAPLSVNREGEVNPEEEKQNNVGAHLRLRPFWIILILLLTLYSLWWQISGIAFRWELYAQATFGESLGLIHWLPGYNELRYLRPVALTALWGQEQANFAWVRANLGWWPLVFGGLAVVGVVALTSPPDPLSIMHIKNLIRNRTPTIPTPREMSTSLAERERPSPVDGGRVGDGGSPYSFLKEHDGEGESRIRPLKYLAILGVLIWPVCAFIGLTALYRADPFYMPEREDLHAIVTAIRERTAPNDVVFINDRQYYPFFFNAGKVGAVWTPILPYHPGDRGSCEQELAITSDNPAVLLAHDTIPIISSFAAFRARMSLVMSTAPEIPCVIRPLERYLGQRYYRLGEVKASVTARLIEYAATSAPDPYAFRGVERLSDARFTSADGESIMLVGYTLPRGTTYRSGDLLPLSLMWQVETTPTRDYTVAWFLADANGGIVGQGEDSWPGATFAPTTLMSPGIAYWDHRALVLPDTLPEGRYHLWVRLYWYNSQTNAIENLAVTGADAGTNDVAILADEILIQP